MQSSPADTNVHSNVSCVDMLISSPRCDLCQTADDRKEPQDFEVQVPSQLHNGQMQSSPADANVYSNVSLVDTLIACPRRDLRQIHADRKVLQDMLGVQVPRQLHNGQMQSSPADTNVHSNVSWVDTFISSPRCDLCQIPGDRKEPQDFGVQVPGQLHNGQMQSSPVHANAQSDPPKINTLIDARKYLHLMTEKPSDRTIPEDFGVQIPSQLYSVPIQSPNDLHSNVCSDASWTNTLSGQIRNLHLIPECDETVPKHLELQALSQLYSGAKQSSTAQSKASWIDIFPDQIHDFQIIPGDWKVPKHLEIEVLCQLYSDS